MIVAGLFLAERRGYISVNLTGGEHTEIEFDRDFYQGGLAPAEELGFQDSRLSGYEVIERAREKAKESAIDLMDYRPPKIALHQVSGVLSWYVTFDAKDADLPFQIVRVIIEDDSQTTYVEKIEKKS